MSSPDLALASTHARSVLARATSAHVRWLDPGCPERHDSLVTTIHLDHPDQAPPDRRSPVVLEIADAAPVPVRDRVRAALRLYGDATRSSSRSHGLRIQPCSVQLESGGRSVTLRPADLWQARPDPLALVEGELLGHLDSSHPEAVAMLARRIPEEIRAGAGRIAPVALDRAGLVLRVEHDRDHVDVRLAFPTEVTDPTRAADALGALIGVGEQTPTEPEVKAPPRRGLLAAVLGAGPAAARLCTPRGSGPSCSPGSEP